MIWTLSDLRLTVLLTRESTAKYNEDIAKYFNCVPTKTNENMLVFVDRTRAQRSRGICWMT